MSLNQKQKLFCELYVLSEDREIRENATAAYSLAYPEGTRESAGRQGHRLLKKDEVQVYISQLRNEKKLKQIKAVQSLEKDILELAKYELSTAKMMIESVNVAYRKARKESNGEVSYTISDRSATAKAQTVRAYLELRKMALDSVASLNGLPDIEDFVIEQNKKQDGSI